MVRASRVSELHEGEVGTRSAEPADTGGGVAAGPPAFGPALEPEVQDAASATTPNATTQIRLTTADLPAPPTACQRYYAKPPLRRLGRPVVRLRRWIAFCRPCCFTGIVCPPGHDVGQFLQGHRRGRRSSIDHHDAA